MVWSELSFEISKLKKQIFFSGALYGEDGGAVADPLFIYCISLVQYQTMLSQMKSNNYLV